MQEDSKVRRERLLYDWKVKLAMAYSTCLLDLPHAPLSIIYLADSKEEREEKIRQNQIIKAQLDEDYKNQKDRLVAELQKLADKVAIGRDEVDQVYGLGTITRRMEQYKCPLRTCGNEVKLLLVDLSVETCVIICTLRRTKPISCWIQSLATGRAWAKMEKDVVKSLLATTSMKGLAFETLRTRKTARITGLLQIA
jgi:hypothetical protein